jgi:hypothetical protein
VIFQYSVIVLLYMLMCVKLLPQLHFANPSAYHEIYNNKNRWDKEAHINKSLGADQSSFGFLTYEESKRRKDVLVRSFSPGAIEGVEGVLVDKVFVSVVVQQSIPLSIHYLRIDN